MRASSTEFCQRANPPGITIPHACFHCWNCLFGVKMKMWKVFWARLISAVIFTVGGGAAQILLWKTHSRSWGDALLQNGYMWFAYLLIALLAGEHCLKLLKKVERLPREKERIFDAVKMLKRILPQKFKIPGVVLMECVLKFFLKKEPTAIGDIYHSKGFKFNEICPVIDKIEQALKDAKFASYRDLLDTNVKKIYMIDLGNSKYYPSAKAIIIKESMAKDYLSFFSRLILLALYIHNSRGKYFDDETQRKVAKELFAFLAILPEETSEIEAYYRNAYRDILKSPDV